MNPHALANAMRGMAQLNSDMRSQTRDGTISGYDPSAHAVKVLLQPEETETGWIQLAAAAVGAGWGVVFAPSIGDAVQVDFILGNAEAPKAVACFFNDVDRAMPVPSGEYWMVHKSGAFMKMTNDGKVAINSQIEVDVTAPTVMIQATGNVNVQAGGQANVIAPAINLGAAGQSVLSIITSAFMALFNTHTHPETGSITGVPNQKMDSSHMTSTVKAS
ncbi:baseplate assembly protein [Pandoraea apista]|nr:baseplate assembly protein [Pandoraea apista]